MSRSPRAEVGREEHSGQRKQPLMQRPCGLCGKDRVGKMEKARSGRTHRPGDTRRLPPLESFVFVLRVTEAFEGVKPGKART